MTPALEHSITTVTPAGAGGGFQQWNSPIPYIFASLGLILGVISMALLILACSFSKSSPNQSSNEKSQQSVYDLKLEMEPRVVIMAGEANPTYLAKPIPVPGCNIEEV